MKQNLSGGVIVIVLIVALVVIGFFGYRYMSGGPNADATAARIADFRGGRQAAAQRAMPVTAPFAGGQAGQRPGGGAPPTAGGQAGQRAMPPTSPYAGGMPGR